MTGSHPIIGTPVLDKNYRANKMVTMLVYLATCALIIVDERYWVHLNWDVF